MYITYPMQTFDLKNHFFSAIITTWVFKKKRFKYLHEVHIVYFLDTKEHLYNRPFRLLSFSKASIAFKGLQDLVPNITLEKMESIFKLASITRFKEKVKLINYEYLITGCEGVRERGKRSVLQHPDASGINARILCNV